MKLVRICPRLYQIQGEPDITVEKITIDGATWWDLFIDDNHHIAFGSPDTLADVRARLKDWTVERLREEA